jgi:hypothetical protein
MGLALVINDKQCVFSFLSLWQQEMTDDLDFYINTYQVYSKDPQNCQEFLESSEVINWKQHLQIQSISNGKWNLSLLCLVSQGFHASPKFCVLRQMCITVFTCKK